MVEFLRSTFGFVGAGLAGVGFCCSTIMKLSSLLEGKTVAVSGLGAGSEGGGAGVGVGTGALFGVGWGNSFFSFTRRGGAGVGVGADTVAGSLTGA